MRLRLTLRCAGRRLKIVPQGRIVACLGLLAAVAFLMATSAPVRGESSQGVVIQLSPIAAEADLDYDASGTATLSNIRSHCSPGSDGCTFTGRLSVKCQNLTPKAQYEVRTYSSDFWEFTAGGKGTGGAAGSVFWGGWAGGLIVLVFRLDEMADGTVVYTPILSGGF